MVNILDLAKTILTELSKARDKTEDLIKAIRINNNNQGGGKRKTRRSKKSSRRTRRR